MPLSEALPRLALVYGGAAGDHSPMRFAEAAEGVCALTWIVPSADTIRDPAMLRFLTRLGEVIDVSGRSTADAAERIRGAAPRGIACFVDTQIAWTAEIAEHLGLPFFSRSTAEQLTDKLAQRTALRDRGLETPPFWPLGDHPDDSLLRDIVEHGFPVVLKPRRGTSSQDTERIEDADQLRSAVAASDPARMLVEGYIPDPASPQVGPGSAPYASVELLVSHGVVSVLGLTGRTPLAPPFRETGFLFPADVGEQLAAELVAVAERAVHALGVETGALHVELKCTDDGPVVIEVNGRPGGAGVHYLLRRAAGIDTVRLVMRLAVGEDVVLRDVPTPQGVAFRIDVQPDADITRVTAVEGLDAVRDVGGVEQVIRGVGPGDRFSWRQGTLGFAAAVLGAAPDHETAHRIMDEVLSTVVVTGERGGPG